MTRSWRTRTRCMKVEEVRYSEGYHDNYYITSMIMNDNLDYVRLNQRIKANKASINGISLLPVEKSLAHGKALIEMRTNVCVAGDQEGGGGGFFELARDA